MIVKTLGDKHNPAILMIPGMFCTYEMPGIIAEYLKDDYYIILPTLDGHHKEEPVYYSKETDAKKIIFWLHANSIDRIAMLQGTSMGAEVALEVARQIDIPVSLYLFDGGPFFHFPRFFRAIMSAKFMSFMKKTRGKEKDQAIDDLMNDPFVKKLGGDSLESYRGLMDGFCEVSQWISRESVRRIADTCYKCDLPDFDEDTVRRFIFLYSEKEPARQAEKRLKKKYPSARYIVMEGYGHGGFQGEQPQQYSEFIRDLLKQENRSF